MAHLTLPAPTTQMSDASRKHTGPILAAVGGAEPESVLLAARTVASFAPAGVVAVSALSTLPAIIAADQQMDLPPTYEQERVRELEAELAGRLEAFGGPAKHWTRRIVRGNPAIVLTELARELDSPLLVMGIGRHRPLDRILGAETTLRAIRRAPCPVLVVHPDLDAPFRDVVIATDFSPSSAYAARVALPLLAANATLHLVHVWQPSNSDADAAYRKALPERFARFEAALDLPLGATMMTVAREGRIAERVLNYASVHNADLIVAGRHGHSLGERLLVGSQTTALVRAADRSLLIAPEPPFPDADRLELLLAGVTHSREAQDWDVELRALTTRNRGRPAVVEVDDIMFNAQVREWGYVLIGASCDPKTRKVEITLGDAKSDERRVTRSMGIVDAIEITSDPDGRDRSLHISHGGGQTSLTFVGD